MLSLEEIAAVLNAPEASALCLDSFADRVLLKALFAEAIEKKKGEENEDS